MKKLLLLSALLIFALSYGQTPTTDSNIVQLMFALRKFQTPITDSNIAQAVETCLSTNPVDGMCIDSEYGAMPDWDVSKVTNMSKIFNWYGSFNGDISNWDVSNVEECSGIFFKLSTKAGSKFRRSFKPNFTNCTP